MLERKRNENGISLTTIHLTEPTLKERNTMKKYYNLKLNFQPAYTPTSESDIQFALATVCNRLNYTIVEPLQFTSAAVIQIHFEEAPAGTYIYDEYTVADRWLGDDIVWLSGGERTCAITTAQNFIATLNIELGDTDTIVWWTRLAEAEQIAALTEDEQKAIRLDSHAKRIQTELAAGVK